MVSWKIIWSEFAEKELDSIFQYYVENAGPKIAKKLLTGIIKAPNRLCKNRELGQIEENLIDLQFEYRYLVHKSYKIIYSVDQKNQRTANYQLSIINCQLSIANYQLVYFARYCN